MDVGWDCGNGIVVESGQAYISNGGDGLRIIDVSGVTNTTLSGTFDTDGRAQGIWVEGEHAFVADGYNGLVVLNVSDPSNPTLEGSIATSDQAIDVEVAGNLAYVLESPGEDAQLEIFDITDPTAPSLEGSLMFSSDLGAGRLLVSGSLVYCNLAYSYDKKEDRLDHGAYLGVVDVSNSAAPTLVTEFCYETIGESEPGGLDLSGNRIYAIDDNILAIIDVSDPYSPVVLGTFVDDWVRDVQVAGDIAYTAGCWDSPLIRAVNVLDPTAPYSAGLLASDMKGVGLVVDGDFAYIASEEYDLQIISLRSRIFSDGFEDGTTDIWSSISP